MPDFEAIATIIVQVLTVMPTIWQDALAFWEAIHGQHPNIPPLTHEKVMKAVEAAKAQA